MTEHPKYSHDLLHTQHNLWVGFSHSNLAMETQESAKRTMYHLHIDLDEDYAPLQKRRKGPSISSTLKENSRAEGLQHIDLWCDGSIYPRCPITNSTPPFSNVTQLLKFVGDGKNGLLGYISNQFASADLYMHLYQREAQEKAEKMSKILQLKEQLQAEIEEHKKTNEKLKKARSKVTPLGERQRRRKIRNIVLLKPGSGGCKRRVQQAR